jgi:hypothetical protein
MLCSVGMAMLPELLARLLSCAVVLMVAVLISGVPPVALTVTA